jgi:hypothetical protein
MIIFDKQLMLKNGFTWSTGVMMTNGMIMDNEFWLTKKNCQPTCACILSSHLNMGKKEYQLIFKYVSLKLSIGQC